MNSLVFVLLLLLINQLLLEHASGKPQIESEDSRTLNKLKQKRLRKLCSLLATGRDLNPEARTLVFLQVQQIQGSSHPVSGDYAAVNALGCHGLGGNGGSGLLGSHFGGGGLLGPLLGGGLLGGGGGGLLGNPQAGLNTGTLEDVVVRPEKYLRPVYRTLRPLVRFFKK